MDYKYIDQLLERYWKGDTSLEEEAILRSFFSQTDIPGHLKRYKELFTLGAIERDECALGSDFDTRMLALVGDEEPVKARTISMGDRLMPLFKAAAMVAIILTLGNAAQVAFNGDSTGARQGVAEYGRPQGGKSVAMGDSMKVDTLHKAAQVPSVLK